MTDNRWINVYFNADQYELLQNGGTAIGYTWQGKFAMETLERAGIRDFELADDPLTHHTKVPPWMLRPLETHLNEDFGLLDGMCVYVSRDKRRWAT